MTHTETAPKTAPGAAMTLAGVDLETLTDSLSGWCEAYPTDIFPEPTKEQMTRLLAEQPGLSDRIGAAMGRHCAKTFGWPALLHLRALEAELATLRAQVRDVRAEALEEAAKVADRQAWSHTHRGVGGPELNSAKIAAAIRALTPQPAPTEGGKL